MVPLIMAAARVLGGAAARGVAARGGGQIAQGIARQGVQAGANHMLSSAQRNQNNQQR